MAQEAEVVHGHDERRPGPERRPEGRAVEEIEAGGGAPEAERVPERVPPDRRELPRAAGCEPDELEARATRELPEEAAHVTCGSGPGLHERRRVDPDPHDDAASRTASRGSG